MSTVNSLPGRGPLAGPLPREATFEPDGHLAEAALTCIADGETDLVPAAALAHLDACDHCTRRVGEAALFSLAAEEAVAMVDPVTMGDPQRVPQTPPIVPVVVLPIGPVRTAGAEALAPRRARRPLPIAAIAAAVIIALVTAGPSLVEGVAGAPGTISAPASTLPFMVRMAEAFARAAFREGGQAPAALFFKCASAIVLAAIGLQVARVTSRERSFQEGGV